MHSSRRISAATSGLLALSVVVSILGVCLVLILPALHALAQTMQALVAVLN